jgi:nickel superoxide dismutase
MTPPTSGEKADWDKYGSSMGRYITVKEEHAELVKREVRIIWGDFFKPEHLDKSPDLHTNVWNILKTASKVRQNIDLAAAEQLLAEVQTFAEAFWTAKGVKTQRVPSQQAVGGELVVPA